LAETTQLTVRIYSWAAPQLPEMLQNIKAVLSLQTPIASRALDANTIVGFGLLTDLANQPALIVQVDEARTIYQHGQTSLNLVLAALIVAGVAYGLISQRLLETTLLTRVAQLSKVMHRLDAERDLTVRAPLNGRDELTSLAVSFNSMAAQLEQSVETLEQRVNLQTAQLQASAEVGRAATSVLDPDLLLKQVTALITARFGYYYAATLLVNASGDWAELREASGPGDTAWVLKQAGYKVPVNGESLIGAAISSRQFKIKEAASLEAGQWNNPHPLVGLVNPLLPDARSEIVLPLRLGDHVLGALDVQSTHANAFDAGNAAVLQAMADQIAVALNNAAQYRQEQARAERSTSLLAATLELSSQPDETSLFEHIERVTSSLLNADGVGLWLPIAEDRLELRHTTSAGSISLAGRQLRMGEGLAGQAYSRGLTLRVDDYPAWPQHSGAFEDAPIHSALGVPLRWQDHTTGVLAITRSQPHQPFTPEEENLAQLLAAQAAAALDNIRLRAEQQQALTDLDILNRRLTGETWQADRLGKMLTYERRRSISTAGEPPGRLVRVPIELRGTPIGALTLEEASARALSADEHTLIAGVVQQLALALENQRLTDVAQQAAQRDRAIAETADKIHQPTDLDAILRVAVNELSRITGISGVGVQLGFAPNGHAADPRQENLS
jgi:GAF domain-containing protein/HAMP domain-containing protein